MFCPSCGSEYTIELKYCNRCGANLNSAITAQPEVVPVNLTKPTLIIGTTLAVLTLGGFGALIGGALSLATVVHGNDPLIAMIFLGMLIILTIDIFLLRQLSKLVNASLESGSPKSGRKQAAPSASIPQLPRLSTAQLTPAPSVTEHTTRFFEPADRAPARSEDRTTPRDLKS
jgi:hypothetical protein